MCYYETIDECQLFKYNYKAKFGTEHIGPIQSQTKVNQGEFMMKQEEFISLSN